MLLGAWPLGGVKHANVTRPGDPSNRCRFIVLCGAYAFFLIIGASIFSVIEAPQLDRHHRELLANKEKFLARHTCIGRE